MVKIVIPTNDKNGIDAKVAMHFGRCETYTLLDEEGKLIEVIGNISEHMGGTGLPPELMKKHGADILLCRGLGSMAIDLCKKLDIDVYVCQAETVKEIFDKWKSGALDKAGNDDSCGHTH